MREVSYRAKRMDNGEWASGGSIIQFFDKGIRKYYIPQESEKCICTHEDGTDNITEFEHCAFYKADPETICQYTGVPDKNGRKIFEGDICRREILGGTIIIGQVVWVEYGMCGFKLKNGNDYYPIGKFEHTGRNDDEVIGNIFDNPELVESEAVQ